MLFGVFFSRYDPKTNQWSSDVAPTSTCRTSVGVAVLGGYLYAVGGQDGVSCLNIVERYFLITKKNQEKVGHSKKEGFLEGATDADELGRR